MEAIKRGDWKLEPAPSSLRRLIVGKSFTEEEMELVRLGLRPREMEDKWFIFYEDPFLFLVRSWTGTIIYQARFESKIDGYALVEADLNADPDAYKSQSDTYEATLLGYLIDRLLLSKRVAIPIPEDISDALAPLWEHSLVGYGRSNSE